MNASSSIVIVVAFVSAAWAAVSFAATPPDSIPKSLGMQLKPPTSRPEDLKAIREAGAGYFRRGFYWNSVEKVKGKYEFAEYDKLLEEAERNGLGVVACLFGGNKAYEDSDGGIQTEAGRQGFANFAAALAERYKGREILWEIWNEPNVRTFWRKSGKHNTDEFAEEYTALVKAVAPAMLKADPDAFIMAGSVSNYWEPSYNWTEFCFKKGILETGIRGWSVHPYGVKTPEEHVIGHTRTRELLKEHGKPNFPILNTERGFAVKKAEEGWSGGSEEKAIEYQSWHIVRQFMIDQMSGVALTMWYEWGGEKFGLLHDGKDRPALQAHKTLAAQMSGYRFARRLSTESELDYVLLFENDKGQRKLVAWTAPPPKQEPDAAKAHPITLPIENLSGQPKASDVYGQATDVKASGGSLTIQLSGSPQYIQLP